MKTQGYTFIEILVVITIIALVASFSMVTYISVGKVSRDARRQSDIESIRSALELFRSETGAYPVLSADINGCLTAAGIEDDSVVPAVVYLAVVPSDPRSPDHCYTYSRISETTYVMTYYSEKEDVVKTMANP